MFSMKEMDKGVLGTKLLKLSERLFPYVYYYILLTKKALLLSLRKEDW